MTKRVLAFGAVLAVLASALLTILAIVDVITSDQLLESLGRAVLVIGVSTAAIVVVVHIARFSRKG